jgi:hypothetical protein
MSIGAEGSTANVSTDSVETARSTDDAHGGLALDAVTLEPLREEGERERPEGDVAGAVADEVFQTWNFGGRSDPGYIANRSAYHPGTRVVVDVVIRAPARSRLAKGGANAGTRVLAGLRNRGYWPFRNCYEQVARELSDPGGKTELVATFSASGKVAGARLLRSSVKNRSIAQCVGAELRGLRLDKPIGYRVDAFVTVSLWPGDLPLLPLPRQAKPEARRSTRYLDVDHALSSLLPVFHECLVPARRLDPKLWGRLSVAFTVDNEGRASDFAESFSHFGDPRAKACVVSVLSGLSWPRPPSGARLVFALRLAKPNPTVPAATPKDGDAPVPAATPKDGDAPVPAATPKDGDAPVPAATPKDGDAPVPAATPNVRGVSAVGEGVVREPTRRER